VIVLSPLTPRRRRFHLPQEAAMEQIKSAPGDAVLVASLAYLSIDLYCEWDGFKGCSRPVHKWLLASYCLVLLSRVIHMIGVFMAGAAGERHFLLSWREKGAASKAMRLMMWLVVIPIFIMWTVVGSVWISDVLTNSPQCLPDAMHVWFFGIWQVLSYAWIAIYVLIGGIAWRVEKRLRKAEVDFRQVVDADVVARWSHANSLDNYALLPSSAGLPPAAIRALPGLHPCGDKQSSLGEDCPICLCAFLPQEPLRKLPACGHVFHRSCVDLWLLRSTECPLCKVQVTSSVE